MSGTSQPSISEALARIEALEVRIAHQDRTIEDLNKSVTDQWRQVDALAKQVRQLTERLQRVEESAPGTEGPDPPPPHD